MIINKLQHTFVPTSWASLLLGWALLVLLNAPSPEVIANSDSYPAFIQQVVDAPIGPHNGNSDQTQFIEAIKESEIGDESQDDKSNLSKNVKPFALAVQEGNFAGFSKQQSACGNLDPLTVSLFKTKLYLAYHQLKIDC